LAGGSIRDLGGGRIAYGLNIETDMTTCTVKEKQLEMLRKVAPCGGYADATAAHENTHVAQCKKRGAGVSVPPNVQAQDEVAGSAAGVQKLEALREEARSACKLKSCPDRNANAAADRLRADLPVLQTAKGGK
jgi:hypothetical protein